MNVFLIYYRVSLEFLDISFSVQIISTELDYIILVQYQFAFDIRLIFSKTVSILKIILLKMIHVILLSIEEQEKQYVVSTRYISNIFSMYY